MIHFNRVTKAYKDIPAVSDVSFSVDKGEFVILSGPSGAGKTTLLKLLIGHEHPTEGEVSYHSLPISKMTSKQLQAFRQSLGVAFQDFRLIPNKTVYENVAYMIEHTVGDDMIKPDVTYVLNLVGLDGKHTRFPNELSGGERQRLALARAIVHQPSVILADEPTANLDHENTMLIVQILKRLNELGATILLATHNMQVIESIGKRTIQLQNGTLAHDTHAHATSHAHRAKKAV